MTVADQDGNVGLPLAVSALVAKRWDAVVVGGGHNGLAAAAYMARAGRSVLVLEKRHELGGACTMGRPFAYLRFIISPCAYLVGLLDPRIIDELNLRRHGYRVKLVDPHLWCPFEDGTALSLWDDDQLTAESVATLAPSDVEGVIRYQSLFARIRTALRGAGRDTWIGPSPDRGELEKLPGHDRESIDVVFHDSIADVVERHVKDPRLRTALHGQGLIGTWAGPRDHGTAAIHAMHSMGSIEGKGGAWGYVEGGMGQVSFALAEAAIEAGAVVASGVPVTAIHPELGVELEGGETIRSRVVVSNTDPLRTVAMCGPVVPPMFSEKVAQWQIKGPVVKVNCALVALPRFTARSCGDDGRSPVSPHSAMVTIAGSIDETQEGYEASRRGEPAPSWCELYFPTVYDSSVAPPGAHVMSVFAQYAPYDLSHGSWDQRREQIGDSVISRIAEFCPDVADVIRYRGVLGPPDIEARIGLSGGHIFQGECLPDQMWDRRFPPRTPIAGVYMCGAATHPGGSVIGINGRNAAMVVLEDLAASK